MIAESLGRLKALNQDRMARFPGSPFFTVVAREIAAIEARDTSPEPIDRAFYDSLNIGLMCARQLETTEPEYYDAVYAMLEDLRLAAEQVG